MTQDANIVLKKKDCMGDFWQKISKFDFKVRNLFFSQYLYATERHSQAGDVESTQFSFGLPQRDPFFDPLRPILWEPL